MPRDLYVVASVLSIKIHSSASNAFYQLISIVFASVKFVDVETLNLNCFCCTLLGFLGVKQWTVLCLGFKVSILYLFGSAHYFFNMILNLYSSMKIFLIWKL